MKIDTFLTAQELYSRYTLCEKILEYLSDPDKTRGMKYKELLAKFADEFNNDFMMFVHTKMEESGMKFEELPECDCDNQPEENPEPPTEPKEPKFSIESKVEIVEGLKKGEVGTVKVFDPKKSYYYVVSPSFSMWFDESILKVYVDESEPENTEENGGADTPDEGE